MKVYKGGKSDKAGKETPNLLRTISGVELATGKEISVNESSAKYSQMLLELIKPYHSDPPFPGEVKDLLDLATMAWNMANMKKLIPIAYNAMWQETKNDFTGDKESIRVLEKMVKEKTKKFGQHDMFIHDAQLKNSQNDFYVNVTAKPLNAFLEEGFSEELSKEDENEMKFEFEPGYINRNAFTITPRQPFFDWLKKLPGNSLFPTETLEPHIFLIGEKDANEEIEDWLKENYDKVFLLELDNWFADEEQFPKKRTYQLFKEWFDISYQSMIYDLEDYPVEKD